jgi:hypothetical protein
MKLDLANEILLKRSRCTIEEEADIDNIENFYYRHNDVILSMMEFLERYLNNEKLKLQRDLIIMKHIQISTNSLGLSVEARDVREEYETLKNQ